MCIQVALIQIHAVLALTIEAIRALVHSRVRLLQVGTVDQPIVQVAHQALVALTEKRAVRVQTPLGVGIAVVDKRVMTFVYVLTGVVVHGEAGKAKALVGTVRVLAVGVGDRTGVVVGGAFVDLGAGKVGLGRVLKAGWTKAFVGADSVVADAVPAAVVCVQGAFVDVNADGAVVGEAC